MKKRQGVRSLLAGIMTAVIGITGCMSYGGEVWAVDTSSGRPIEVRVNGGRLLLESPPFIHNGRVMVPFRGISRAMGAEVRWDQAKQTAIVSNGKHTTSYTVGQNHAIKDSEAVTLDAPPLLKDGRVYIPLRFSAEGLGGKVVWNNQAKEAMIYPLLTPKEAEAALSKKSNQAITLLKNKDFEKLAELAHPDGITFSPYAHVDRQKDVTLSKQQLRKGFNHDTLYRWGEYDGSGEPISMNFESYYHKFVYTLDFAAAPWIGYNQSKSEGNTVNNASSQYKGAVIVEYYYEGVHPDYAGMDWESLRLVFEPYGEEWVLSGVIHDQWTI
ncbi:copper amine oxidase [Paenibacillus sp. LC231]|uniref:copper amine oxidase N-terminal domain-containing protein n=1 Tax=Paenibacillus sp. LC231 TaxID=1120679 RepID=UPI0008DE6416|nr:copper amine oxidase N-terminal domain-containing protein [Paenibacillus sp. LC231]OIA99478.1 copper amine oxidase [Paenibacillus sp. LC231]